MPEGAAAGPDPGGLSLARVFNPTQPVGEAVRLPLALADGEGALIGDPPRRFEVRVGLAEGDLGPPTFVARHDQGIPQAYFPLMATFDEPGSWRIVADVEGAVAETTVRAVGPSELASIPNLGDDMIALATPTTGQALGVDPVCTLDPPCPLHEVSLDDALAGGGPVALLVSTPAFCQTAICGPVLELFVARQAALADRLTMVHAEVYTDDTAAVTTAAVKAYALTFEPSLFVAGTDKRIVARLDYTFDAAELDDALDLAIA